MSFRHSKCSPILWWQPSDRDLDFSFPSMDAVPRGCARTCALHSRLTRKLRPHRISRCIWQLPILLDQSLPVASQLQSVSLASAERPTCGLQAPPLQLREEIRLHSSLYATTQQQQAHASLSMDTSTTGMQTVRQQLTSQALVARVEPLESRKGICMMGPHAALVLLK